VELVVASSHRRKDWFTVQFPGGQILNLLMHESLAGWLSKARLLSGFIHFVQSIFRLMTK
jgi:hypothetical protein